MNQKYELKNILIDFSNIPHPHGGVDIMEKIEMCIKDFKIDDEISTITTDNVTNNIKAISELKKSNEVLHFRCFAHIMNLAVRSGLNNFKTEIDKLRSFISKIRNSSLKTQIFKKCCDNFEIDFLKPKIDMIVRWNSTHEMINWAMNFKRIINDLRFYSDEFKYFEFKEID